jgi:hypothetical protein
MAVERWPYNEGRYEHKQGFYNSVEQLTRVLTQSSIGIYFSEGSSTVSFNLNPNNSLNHISFGLRDITKSASEASTTYSFNTTTTGFIYIGLKGTPSFRAERPTYESYLHGWYDIEKAERAIIFIDSKRPAGYRCKLMEGFNVLYDYDRRVPTTKVLVYTVKTDIASYYEKPFEIGIGPSYAHMGLGKGWYTFELKGGHGGEGGRAMNPIDPNTFTMPGRGGASIPAYYTVEVTRDTLFNLRLGGDGMPGESVKAEGGKSSYDNYKEFRYTDMNNMYLKGYAGNAGGGGAGGSPTILWNDKKRILMYSAGGGGGGGAQAITSDLRENYYLNQAIFLNGAGGGGCGGDSNINAYHILDLPSRGGGVILPDNQYVRGGAPGYNAHLYNSSRADAKEFSSDAGDYAMIYQIPRKSRGDDGKMYDLYCQVYKSGDGEPLSGWNGYHGYFLINNQRTEATGSYKYDTLEIMEGGDTSIMYLDNNEPIPQRTALKGGKDIIKNSNSHGYIKIYKLTD